MGWSMVDDEGQYWERCPWCNQPVKVGRDGCYKTHVPLGAGKPCKASGCLCEAEGNIAQNIADADTVDSDEDD